MMNSLITLLVNKNEPLDLKQGALYAVLAIVLVFVVLLIIIGITTLIFKLQGLFEFKKEVKNAKKNAKKESTNASVNITDDDMMAAVLVATIDYRLETKKDVRVISVKQIVGE